MSVLISTDFNLNKTRIPPSPSLQSVTNLTPLSKSDREFVQFFDTLGHNVKNFLEEVGKVALVSVLIIEIGIRIAPLATIATPAALFSAVVIAPIWEEIFFRGFFQTSLEYCLPSTRNPSRDKDIRVWTTVIVFGLAHSYPIQKIIATIFGISAGYLKEKTHTVSYPILYHSIANGMVYLIGEIFLRNLPFLLTHMGSISIMIPFHVVLYSSMLLLDYCVYKYSTSKPNEC